MRISEAIDRSTDLGLGAGPKFSLNCLGRSAARKKEEEGLRPPPPPCATGRYLPLRLGDHSSTSRRSTYGRLGQFLAFKSSIMWAAIGLDRVAPVAPVTA